MLARLQNTGSALEIWVHWSAAHLLVCFLCVGSARLSLRGYAHNAGLSQGFQGITVVSSQGGPTTVGGLSSVPIASGWFKIMIIYKQGI